MIYTNFIQKALRQLIIQRVIFRKVLEKVDQYPSSGETVMWCNAAVRCNFNKLDVFPRLLGRIIVFSKVISQTQVLTDNIRKSRGSRA